MPGETNATFASLILATTFICLESGMRMIACRSRTISPASIMTCFEPRQLVTLA